MKVVYIAHPLGHGADREANRARAARWVAWAGVQGVAPVADWIVLSGEWDETRREQGLAIDFALIERCDELWLVGGRISPGMQLEADHARRRGTLVRTMTGIGDEPPPVPAWAGTAKVGPVDSCEQAGPRNEAAEAAGPSPGGDVLRPLSGQDSTTRPVHLGWAPGQPMAPTEGGATHEPSEASRSAIRDVKKAAYRRLAGISNGSRGKCEQCGKWEEVPLHMEMGVMLCSECFRRPLDSSGGAIVKLPHIAEPSSLPSDADRAWALSFRKAFATEPDEFAATVLAKTLADVRAEGHAVGRADALEEAARVADSLQRDECSPAYIAGRIRALAKKGTP